MQTKLDRFVHSVTIEYMIEVSGGLKRPSNMKLMLIGGGVVVLLLAAVAGYFAWQFFTLKQNPNKANEETVSRLTGEIGKFYDLPNEQPTVAQVQDKEKLKGQTFFDKAENGDYIVIYTNAKLALLYREKDNKLINVGPINISDQNAAQTQAQQPAAQQQPAATPKKK